MTTTATPTKPRNTKALVFEAADKMFVAGEARKINVRSIMSKINYGSNGTVNDALEQWWAQMGQRFQQSQDALQNILDLPDASRATFKQLINEIQEVALETAMNRMDDIRAKAEQDVKVAQAQSQTAEQARIEIAKKLEKSLDNLRALEKEIVLLNELLSAEKNTASRLENDIESIKNQLHAAQEKLDALAKSKSEQEDYYRNQEKRLSELCDSEKNAKMAAEKQNTTLTSQLHATKSFVNQQHITIEANQTATNRLEKQLADFQQEIRSLNHELTDKTHQLTELQKETSHQAGELSSLRSQLFEQKSDFQTLHHEKQTLAIELRELVVDKKQLSEAILRLKRQLKKNKSDKAISD